jgi:hypothetical protein
VAYVDSASVATKNGAHFDFRAGSDYDAPLKGCAQVNHNIGLNHNIVVEDKLSVSDYIYITRYRNTCATFDS